MTTIDWIMSGSSVLAALRLLRVKALHHLHRPTGVSLTKGEAGRPARRIVEAGVHVAFFAWLYYVTDGAAFSPLGFASESVWRSALAALGLS